MHRVNDFKNVLYMSTFQCGRDIHLFLWQPTFYSEFDNLSVSHTFLNT